jgi:hypothetical protein
MFYLQTKTADDWARGLADPTRQWRKGFSARSLAFCWESEPALPPEFAAHFGSDATLVLGLPEHSVEMPGRGKASQTDLFCLISDQEGLWTVAIEGKVEEPFGPTVGDWLSGGGQNRRDRIEGIAAELGMQVYPELRYQLYHRAASAVLEARRFRARNAAMIVHSFSQAETWRSDFNLFAQALGAAPDTLTPFGIRLRLGWATGNETYLEY